MKKILIFFALSIVSIALSAQTTTNAVNTLDAGSAATGSIFRVSASSFANGKKRFELASPASLLAELDIQQADTFRLNGRNLELSLQRDGIPALSVNLHTLFTAGAGIAINASGVISSTASAPDGSETKVNAGTAISVTGAGTTASPYVINSTGDNSTTNEIQTISLSANTLSLSLGGGSVILPVADGSETKVTAGTGIGITGAGTTASPYVFTPVDQSATNEIQTLSLSNSTFTLSNGGGSVTLKRWVYKTHTKAVATATMTIPAGAPTALTDIQVYIGGVKMTPSTDNYTVSGTTLTFVQGAPGADVEILYWE